MIETRPSRSGSTRKTKDSNFATLGVCHLTHNLYLSWMSVRYQHACLSQPLQKNFDIDRDGTIDMVFFTCTSVSSSGIGNNCAINIAYNQQLPLCTSSTLSSFKDGERVCRTPEQLCVADPNFSFNLSEDPNNNVCPVRP
jgi:hypothetical protein